MITRYFDLMLFKNGTAPCINVNQYDEGETWVFTLYGQSGVKYTPSSGAIVALKSDGHLIANAGTVDGQGRVVITETQQMTASAGKATCELQIDGETHGTANFYLLVEPSPADGGIPSDSDLSLFQQAVDAAETIEELIEGHDPDEVIADAVDAWLDIHPEATTTVQDGAITAPKINNSLWDKLLVSESASGEVASFDDGADDVPVSSLKVNLEPIQTGTGDPSPTNVRPIYPANGKNLFDKDNANILNGYINGSATITSSAVDRMVYIPILANQTFSVTFTQKALVTATQSDDMQIGLFDSTPVAGLTGIRIYNAMRTAPTVDMNVTYTGSTSSHTWLALKIGNTARTDITASMATLQIEYGNATPYQPYQGIVVQQTGKNLLPPFVVNVSWESGNATVVGTGDGAYKFNGTTTGYQQSVIQSDIHLKAGTYTFGATVEASGTPLAIGAQLRSTDGSITYAAAMWNNPAATFTLTEDTVVRMRFVVWSASSVNNVVFKPQIEVGSEATSYEPYQSTSYTYSLGQSVYGGSVDLATGVLTVEYIKKTITSFDGAWGAQTNAYCVYVNDSATSHETLTIDSAKMVSDKFTYSSHGRGTMPEWCYGGNDGGSQISTFAFPLSFTSLAECNTWAAANPIEATFMLATPQTIQLTPQEVKTLLGYNNISSSGTVEVIYHADTKLYVDKMTAVDNNIIAPTEEGFTATRNYTVNDLLIVNDTLYKVTANIANGGTITPNSNVQQTTLSALIKALS